MSADRTRLIFSATFVVLAALQANSARAGFVRAEDVLATGAHSTALASIGLSPDLLGGAAGPVEPSDRPRPQDDRDRDPLALRSFCARLANTSGMSSSASSSNGTGPGSSTCAIVTSVFEVPQLTPTGRLPEEMGIAFSSPPPWKPLRPPRAEIEM
ncbi:MAG: hypothetical protein NUV77_26620 [Thermoguttaceae bacterium]|jgi:hypothetical protein|nr:hypothetical protein [Thermoguttaceae bacterium]